MRKLISVTKNDIKLGRKCDSMNCPIAIAIDRTLKKRVSWGYHRGFFLMGNSEIIAPNKKSTTEFVADLDNGKRVKPFKFYVEI